MKNNLSQGVFTRIINIFFHVVKKIIALLLLLFAIFSITNCYAVSVGDSYGGGTVFCVSQTPDTTQCVTTGSGCYGLVMANADIGSGNLKWTSSGAEISTTGATSLNNGAANTAKIITYDTGTTAASACYDYLYQTCANSHCWYLPARTELLKVRDYAFANNLIGRGCTGSIEGGVQCFVDDKYWSSTESSASYAFYRSFDSGSYGTDYKTNWHAVRPIRAFNAFTVYQFSKAGNEDTVIYFAVTDFTNNTSCGYLTKIKILSLPANGALKLSGIDVTANQEIVAGDLGNLTFVPNTNWNGNTSFSWQGIDGETYATAVANVNIIIGAVNDAPLVTPLTKLGTEDTILTFSATDFNNHFSDLDNKDLVKIKILSLPSHGILKLSDIQVFVNDEITVENLCNLTFVPNANWSGNTSFSWNGSNGALYAINPASVNIAISAVLDPPTISTIFKIGTEDTVLAFGSTDFTNNFIAIESNGLTKVKITSLPNNGTLKFFGNDVLVDQEIDTENLGYLTFEPETNWNGNTNFGWNGSDGTAYATNPSSVNIIITAVNDTPIVGVISKLGMEDTVLNFNSTDFTSNFIDAEGGLIRVKITSLPDCGTLKFLGDNVVVNQEIDAINLGYLTYEPKHNWNGNTSFGWNGSDGVAYATNPSSVSITIATENDVPLVSDMSKSTISGTTCLFSANDFTSHFSDMDGDSLKRIKIISLPSYGTLKFLDNDVSVYQEIDTVGLDDLTYNSPNDWIGNTRFSWKGSDGVIYSADTANVDIAITPFNSNAETGGFCEKYWWWCYVIPESIAGVGVLVPTLLYLHKNQLCCFKKYADLSKVEEKV